MYHALMLEGFLDVLNCITPQTEGYDNLLDTSKRMTDVLFSLQRPDGSFPLFNDATHEIAHPVHTLLAYGQAITGHTPLRVNKLPDTGYYIHHDEQVFLAIDGGIVGPDHLMAHAHADVFSYELCLEGLPIVIDYWCV